MPTAADSFEITTVDTLLNWRWKLGVERIDAIIKFQLFYSIKVANKIVGAVKHHYTEINNVYAFYLLSDVKPC